MKVHRDDSPRVLSQEASEALVTRLAGFARGGGLTIPTITSWWNGEVRWGRNRVTLAGDRRDIGIEVRREVHGAEGRSMTNQVDDVSLEGVVRAAERSAAVQGQIYAGVSVDPPPPSLPLPRPTLWSDATYNLSTEERAALVPPLIVPAEAQGLLSAGYLEVRAGSRLELVNGVPHYVKFTQAQCSMTVRDVQGTGSGWAGASSYDWAKIDAPALAARALQKCVASRNPVALEPGRYMVILEPQAVADLLEVLVDRFDRGSAERGEEPFALSENSALKIWRTKLGLKVIDPRLTLSHDPADPALGILPEPGQRPITWINAGTLVNLAYDRAYAVRRLQDNVPGRSPEISYRLTGGETSMEEMITTTRRGLLVTRLWGVRRLNPASLLATGLTRDGLWLIENGKITKAVKNFRFTESPLFVLNQVEQLGESVPVFRPQVDPDRSALTPAIVPAIKARDFSFTSMADAT